MKAKLVRTDMAAKGPLPPGLEHVEIEDEALIGALLVAKLHEEGGELAKASDPLDELGDCFEGLHALAHLAGYSMEDVRRHAHTKSAERGGLLITTGLGGVRAMLQREVE
jgi:predicted house-cleaning noncanonical NTP pyrophosphatase (MazG superfamily)